MKAGEMICPPAQSTGVKICIFYKLKTLNRADHDLACHGTRKSFRYYYIMAN